MKKILYFISALMLMVSCGGDKGGQHTGLTLEQKLCTEWHSTTLSLDADIYISFAEDKTFELYQQIGEGSYRLYRGIWSLDEKTCILSGKYNDGEAWGTSYAAAIEGNTLTLTSTDAAAEKSTYKSEEIPETVKSSCITVVKSAEAGF